MPKYARDEGTGEIIQFTDPKQPANNASGGGSDTARSAPVMDPQQDDKQNMVEANGAFRKQVLGDNAFTKEELAIKSIRDEAKQGQDGAAAAQNEESKVPASYQNHVDKINRKNSGSGSATKAKADSTKKGYIPCLYLPYLGGSSKLLIYFHGNAEDIGLAMELLAFVKDMLKVSGGNRHISLFRAYKQIFLFDRYMYWPWSILDTVFTKESQTQTKSHWTPRMSTIT